MPDYTLESMQRAVGSGSWPQPCQKEGVTYSVNEANMPSITAANKVEIFTNVIATYAKVGVRLVFYSGSGQANIRVSFRVLAGSTIGLAEFNSRSCSDSVFCYLDSGFNANKFAIMDLLCHEMGHNMNLNHTRGGIMNASLGSVNSFRGWTPEDPSWNTLKRYFGGEPLDPVPVPGPAGEVEFRSGIFFVDALEVGRLSASGGITYIPGTGDVIYQGQPRGRLIMIPPA
jgi:hypothetical protein